MGKLWLTRERCAVAVPMSANSEEARPLVIVCASTCAPYTLWDRDSATIRKLSPAAGTVRPTLPWDVPCVLHRGRGHAAFLCSLSSSGCPELSAIPPYLSHPDAQIPSRQKDAMMTERRQAYGPPESGPAACRV